MIPSRLELNSHVLGTLGTFPREIRDMIYKHFICWHQCRNDTTVRLRSQHVARDSLSILRTNSHMYQEVSALLYQDWTLTFFMAECEMYLSRRRRKGDIHPLISCRASHHVYGNVDLPSFSAIQESKLYLYRNMPHGRWRSIHVEIRCPAKGGYVTGWRASKAITSVFQHRRPREILIIPKSIFARRPYIVTKAKKRELGSYTCLEILLVPFYRLNGTVIQIPRFHQPYIPYLSRPHPVSGASKIEDAFLGTPTDLVCLSHYSNLDDPTSILPAGHGISEELSNEMTINEDLIECWFDLHLDFMKGEKAAIEREHRWFAWDAEYEQQIIRASTALRKSTRKRLLAALAERWAVMRLMDMALCDADFLRWDGKAGPEKRPKSNMNNYGNLRSPDCWFAKLKYKGLFYHRRILLTNEGILWDPKHTVQTSDVPFEPREDVLLVHEPDVKPEKEPEDFDDEEGYYFEMMGPGPFET